VEELIEQAKSELELIPLYASWKMWEQQPPTPTDDDFSGAFSRCGTLIVPLRTLFSDPHTFLTPSFLCSTNTHPITDIYQEVKRLEGKAAATKKLQ
jgi:hypothetical protein